MISEQHHFLKNSDETKKLGAHLAQQLHHAPSLIFLSGDLGAGKTTLVQGLIGQLITSTLTIQSPTYAYVHHYQGHIPIFHFDLYRIEDPETIFELGLYEQLTDEHALRIVEWPECLATFTLAPTLHISLTQQNQQRRAVIKYFKPLPSIP